MSSQIDIIKQLGGIALGSRLKRLSDLFMHDIDLIYKKLNINFEPRWFALTSYLYDYGDTSILELADSLKFSHPAVVQIVNQMLKKKLVEAYKDKTDKRKRMIKLSDKGKELFESINPLLGEINDSVKEIIQSTGYDFLHVIESIEKELDAKGIYERTITKSKQRLLNSVNILRYSPQYKEDFKNLNYEWLQKYFTVEPKDEIILSNPEEEVINKGGEIFFAVLDEDIVGTCAAIKIDDKTYELAKMAVTEKAQGKQIGKKLALAVIGFAYSNNAASVILFTNRKLQAAINLYESLGFQSVPSEENSLYRRETFKMKLDLTA